VTEFVYYIAVLERPCFCQGGLNGLALIMWQKLANPLSGPQNWQVFSQMHLVVLSQTCILLSATFVAVKLISSSAKVVQNSIVLAVGFLW